MARPWAEPLGPSARPTGDMMKSGEKGRRGMWDLSRQSGTHGRCTARS